MAVNLCMDPVGGTPMIKFHSCIISGNHWIQHWQKLHLTCKAVCDLTNLMVLHYLWRRLLAQQTAKGATLATSTKQWKAQTTKSLAQRHQFVNLWETGLIGMAAFAAAIMRSSTARSRRRRKHVVEHSALVSRDASLQSSQFSTDVNSIKSESPSDDGHHGSHMIFEEQDDWLQLDMGGCSRHVVQGQPISFAHLRQPFGQLRHDLNSHCPQPHIVNLPLPEQQHQQQEQQEQQQQQDALLSREPALESESDFRDMENMSSSVDDNGVSEPGRGHAGFVRQRTLELNRINSQPVFPWLSESSNNGMETPRRGLSTSTLHEGEAQQQMVQHASATREADVMLCNRSMLRLFENE